MASPPCGESRAPERLLSVSGQRLFRVRASGHQLCSQVLFLGYNDSTCKMKNKTQTVKNASTCLTRRVNRHMKHTHTHTKAARAWVINVSLPPPEQISMIIWAQFSNLLFPSERRWNPFLRLLEPAGRANLAAGLPLCLNRWGLPASISKVYLKHTHRYSKKKKKRKYKGTHKQVFTGKEEMKWQVDLCLATESN